MVVKTIEKMQCFHCGEVCDSETIRIDGKFFCCDGCKTVYELLSENNLCTYYNLGDRPGRQIKSHSIQDQYAFLDQQKVRDQIIGFTDGTQTRVVFYIPQMHCSSCIWLLENFHKLCKGVIQAQVNFPKKEIAIMYLEAQTNLPTVVAYLAAIGYEPHFSLNDLEKKRNQTSNRRQYLMIGIAGFCFANIMMFSFPEYLSKGELNVAGLKEMLGFINLFLALPVLFYCSKDFFTMAWKSLKQHYISIDAPIALAILITFLRSACEIIGHTGPGYLDSMSGIVFFMLLGRAFQSKTYETLSFDRDYKSYFPVTVRLKTDTEIRIPLSDLKAGDHIIVRNNELIPADATLRQGAALIDYSFVSGESAPVYKAPGEIIYAGARQTGSSIELEVVKSVAQSYLTELWNNEVFLKKENQEKSFMDRISHWFSLAVFMISLNAGLYWMFMNAPDKAINAATAVLIVACPCALLLSGTFTNGAILRILGKNNLYLKNAAVIEKLADIDTVVFDKTGTLTSNGKARVLYDGIPISVDHQNYLYSAVMHSTHPFSRAIASILPIGTYLEASSFKELPGLGIEAQIEGHTIKVGSKAFIEPVLNSGQESGLTSCVYVSIDGFIPGCFRIKNEYRKGLGELLHQMKQKFHLVMLSGDNEGEKPMLSNFFKGEAMFFKQSPQDKLDAIRNLQKQGRKVLMLGDGLNDAGALKQSDTGFAVSDETMNFSPACDGIMDGAALYKLNQFIGLSQAGRKIITASFIISILYNFFGIYFAVAGNLRPVIAAILMPASTVSIVLFTTGITTLTAKRFNLK